MNARVEQEKTTWPADRATINQCFRRHPVFHFIVLFSILFTAASFVAFAFRFFGYATTRGLGFVLMPFMLAVIFVVFNRSRRN
jgi:hypothetical protein